MKFILFLITVIGLSVVITPSQEPCPVDLPCGGIPRWAEHGNISWRDERARLNNLASQFRKSPDHVIYFLVYAGMRSCKDEARLRALRAKNYLVKHHSIPPKSISWRDGGFRSELQVEIWLLPQGKPFPEPSNFLTIDPADVRSLRNCKELSGANRESRRAERADAGDSTEYSSNRGGLKSKVKPPLKRTVWSGIVMTYEKD